MKNKNVNLGEGSVGKLLINLAVPAIIAQMVNLLYNIVDRIFIGRMANGEIDFKELIANINLFAKLIQYIYLLFPLSMINCHTVATLAIGETSLVNHKIIHIHL